MKMEARNIPAAGKQVTVEDLIVLSDWLHTSINITGRLDEHDVAACHAKLGAPKQKHSVLIDTRLVEPFDARIGSVFQFIGEVTAVKLGEEEEEETAVVEARVVRSCDGLDLVRYQQALRAQREFLDSRE